MRLVREAFRRAERRDSRRKRCSSSARADEIIGSYPSSCSGSARRASSDRTSSYDWIARAPSG